MVRIVGSFAVESHGSADVTLGSRKARRLLAALAVHRTRTVPADELVHVLWGDAPPARPVENVATLVSRLRAAVGPAVVLGGRDGYRLGGPPEVRVDVDDAARFVAEATARTATEPGLAAAAAQQALRLLGTGAVLVDEADADWAAPARAEAERLLRAARLVAADASTRCGDHVTAVAAAAAALADDPLDESAARLAMAAHQASGEPAHALAVFERLRVALADSLGVDPAPETRELHLALVRGRRAPPGRTPPTRPPTGRPPTGRDRESQVLLDAWTAAVAGRGGLVLLVGEAGIGKTTLADRLRDTATSTGGRVLFTRCYAAERSLFLQPFVDALTTTLSGMSAPDLVAAAGLHASALVDLFPPLAPVLGPPAAERTSTDVATRRTFEAVTGVLAALAAGQPTLLVLDDLQNAGAATVELVHFLARRTADTPLLVVATVRVEEGHDVLALLGPVGSQLAVGPLDAAAVATLAAAAGHAPMADAILARTGGHTLFVVETLGGLRAGASDVPASLRSAVVDRLEPAGADTTDLLRAAAVVGASVDPEVVAGMLGVAAHVAVQRCERAVAARLLVPAGSRYEFANDLLHEILYATTPEPLRRAHHHRAADLLADTPEAVAVHAAAVHDLVRAARALEAAAAEATRRGAMTDAEILLGRALSHAEQARATGDVARVYLARGRVREAIGEYRRAAGDDHAALATARDVGDRHSEMLALRALGGHASLAIGVPAAECARSLRAGLVIAESLGDDAVTAEILGWSAVLSTNRLRFADALASSERAVAAARRSGSDTALAVALDGRKNALTYLGRFAELPPVLAELEPLLRRSGHLELLQWCVFESAFPAVARGDWATAQCRIDDALVVNRRSGHPVHESWFVAHLGWVARLRGDIDGALAHGRRAVALASSLSHRWFVSDAGAVLGATLIEAGERAEAVRVLERSLERAGPNGAEAHLLRCLGPLAEVTGSATVLADADALLGSIDAPPGSAWFGGCDAYLSIGRAHLARGDRDRAAAAVAPLLTASRDEGWTALEPLARAVADRAGADLTDRAGAD
ncbi:SARP family transcriptional regulator [Pseudonocardia sulfidoxydans NBRC 16205]|uniref:SARP family transcriptional regulator n=1 Tax=Pseudonocardia sulfidoxydans NBRC 16205 TaxID=1223511 RepID=A0A511DHF4_9PSEU|nr:SARP family transcriptional regulator [Pseudonocardia sulfidoxydans NBRC 16205]